MMKTGKRIAGLILGLFLLISAVLSAAVADEAAVGLQQDVMILFTSDVHCGITKGFGAGGLMAVRENLAKTNYVLLVDDGDSIQGEAVGLLSRGLAGIELMNVLQYDVAIPGNHEFDYGVDRLLELTQVADFPYLSCNISKEGQLVFQPYIIKEIGGIKIAFVGVTTPKTMTSSTPRYFQNAEGDFIYSFAQGDGSELYAAVQKAVDGARGEGADYVFLIAHLGYDASDAPYTYADVVGGTSGIDAVLDGHSHDTDKVVMKNRDGKSVIRQACGTKLQSIGWLRISASDGRIDTGLYTWNNDISLPELIGIQNPAQEKADALMADVQNRLGAVVGTATVDLVSDDPVMKDDSGAPIRLIRRTETNLGDLIADAMKEETGAETAIVSGGGIRQGIRKGRITMNDMLSAMPFGNQVMVIEATGQQILNALEWGSRVMPDESGSFCHVSGITYEIHTYIPTSCKKNEDGMFTTVEGEYRVRNVMVNGEPLDLNSTYTVASQTYALIDHGSGQTAFDGARVVQEPDRVDFELVADYIRNRLNGVIGEEYADPYGCGRIVGVGTAP